MLCPAKFCKLHSSEFEKNRAIGKSTALEQHLFAVISPLFLISESMQEGLVPCHLRTSLQLRLGVTSLINRACQKGIQKPCRAGGKARSLCQAGIRRHGDRPHSSQQDLLQCYDGCLCQSQTSTTQTGQPLYSSWFSGVIIGLHA